MKYDTECINFWRYGDMIDIVMISLDIAIVTTALALLHCI